MIPGNRTCRRLALGFSLGLAAMSAGWSQAPPDEPQHKPVALLAAIEGPIGPAAVRHVEKAVASARERDAAVLILRVDTPGGLAASMRGVISAILSSPVPVAGYVAPAGAHAASAGTYIVYATHIAAMAPGTNLGAATPVQLGEGLPGLPGRDDRDRGKDGGKPGESGETAKDPPAKENAPPQPKSPSGDAMTRKAVNDAVAFIRSLADMHGRNAEWAESAVREAASLSARDALEKNVIDIVAPDVESLLDRMDGRKVTVGNAEVTLKTKGLRIERIEQDLVTEALAILSNPNVALILMMIGVYGLIFEFMNPGAIGPGVAGVVCLILGLYSLNQLPLNYAGLALVLFGLAFMAAEAFVPAFGALGVGGLVAFVIGSAMLIDTDAPAFQLSWWVIGTAAATSGAFLIFLIGYMWKVYRRPGPKDAARMAGAEGTVLDWANGEGHVWAHSERWSARGAATLKRDDTVRVRGMDGLTLIVDAADGTENAGENGPRGNRLSNRGD